MQFDRYVLLMILFVIAFHSLAVSYHWRPLSWADDNHFDLDSMYVVPFLQASLVEKMCRPCQRLACICVVICQVFHL